MNEKRDAERRLRLAGKPEWEEIAWSTYRLKVNGGWLYRYGDHGYGFCPVITFAPDGPSAYDSGLRGARLGGA